MAGPAATVAEAGGGSWVTVPATEHPDVDRVVELEARRAATVSGWPLPPYRGVWVDPDNVVVHLWAVDAVMFSPGGHGFRRLRSEEG